jgi:ATP-dependent helicase/nuclease subunit B
MRIEFGWTLDRAPWQTRSKTDGSNNAGTTVVTGPLGLLGILQTRLGTTRPTIDRPIRIAQYRSLLAQADHPWYRRSFANDPWNTAHHLLELRDDAIEAGWKPATDGQDYSAHPRLDALATVESLVVIGPPHDTAATLAPGRADDVRESLELLRLYGASWPLGIDSIELRDKRDTLPQVWQDILGAVEAAGVTVTEPAAPTNTPQLTIVRGPDNWSTAEAAARYLANVNDRERICIIAGDATAVLDQQLARRRAPTLGIADSNAANPSAQILPVFLGAVLPPTDIRRVAEFLHLSFGTNDATSTATSLVPQGVSSVLLQALTQEPGISNDPESAWMRALDQLKSRTAENSEIATRTWETAQALDGFLRTRPPAIDSEELDLASLNPALDWLATRLRRLNGNRTADTAQDDTTALIAEAATHLASFRAAISRLGTNTIRVRELFDIAESSAPTATRVDAHAQAADWTVVTSPAEVPEGSDTVIWWCSQRSATSANETWDPAEIVALAQSGVRISTSTEKERLRQAAELDGLRASPNVTCFCPETSRGEPVTLHPVLSRLAEDIAVADGDRFPNGSVDTVLSDPTVARSVADLITDGTWQLDDVAIPTSIVSLEQFTAPNRVSRVLDGDFRHLLPETLSFSQIDQLLSDPLGWTLERGLGLSRGFTFDIPTDNRMIGNLVHAVVEYLVQTNDSDTSATTPVDIAKAFDRLVPRFASELLLPGQLARKNTIRSTATASLVHLFTTLRNRGITIVGAETGFDHDWVLTVAGEAMTVQLRGQRDLEGAFSDSRPAIIDLKWANYEKRYRTMIDDGEAVQLSVYSHTSDSPTGANPLTAYFMLKQGRFISTDSGLDENFNAGTADSFDDDGNGLGGDPVGLWPMIQASIEHTLSAIATGRFDSLNADVHAEFGVNPHTKSTQVDKALKTIKADELDEDRLFVAKNQSYSNFNLIYGIAGDHS